MKTKIVYGVNKFFNHPDKTININTFAQAPSKTTIDTALSQVDSPGAKTVTRTQTISATRTQEFNIISDVVGTKSKTKNKQQTRDVTRTRKGKTHQQTKALQTTPLQQVPSLVSSTVPSTTKTKSLVDTTTFDITKELAKVSEKQLSDVFTDVTSQTQTAVNVNVFTPKFFPFIPPLPGGGGGGGGFGFGRRSKKVTKFQPSLLGVTRKVKRVERPFLTGLEVRGINTATKRVIGKRKRRR